MKYKLLQDLPFMKDGDIFGKGCWPGGGWGVDLGCCEHGSHNGTKTFKLYENNLLDSIIHLKAWVEWIPEDEFEKLDMYDKGMLTKSQFIKFMK